MKKIMVIIIALTLVMSSRRCDEDKKKEEDPMNHSMTIKVHANGNTTVFKLNNNPAARDLYSQLPLRIVAENYGNNEKIFYPPKKLNTTATSPADARAGTLAYYAPWGDVVMFYGSFGSAAGLYELGQVVSGSEYIAGMSGTILIEKSNQPIKINIKLDDR